MKKSMILFIFIAFIGSCDFADNRLRVVNDSNTDIYLYYSCDSSLSDFQILRNGFYSNENGDSTYVQADEYVQKRTALNIPRKGLKAWTLYLKNCENEEMHFFIYLDSLVKKYTDEELKNKKMYEKHIVYAAKEFEQKNWTVTYP